MALRKCMPSSDASSLSMAPSDLPRKVYENASFVEPESTAGHPLEADVDIDLREVYFLIMHFLSAGPCRRTFGQFWNELLEHQLLPRRYHAWYSRRGKLSGDENDNGLSFPLNYNSLVERYPHIGNDHLVRLLKQLILNSAPLLHGTIGGNIPSAADVPTLLGSGSFSLLDSDRNREEKKAARVPVYLRWPHMKSDQVRGLSLREIGGGFTRHHRAPSIRAACYAIAKPSTMVQKMQIIKKLRGHQNAVYCAIFDRSGRYVITGSDDRLVKIWSMETAFCLSSCRGHEGDITDLAVSSNNALVASASNDCIIRVWRLPDGLPISVLRGHAGAVTAIAFNPRPSAVYQLLSSSDDGTCRVWDARYSQHSPRIYIPKPSDAVTGRSNDPSPSNGQQGHQILCCAYNANGNVFVTGSSDTYARVWNVAKCCNQEDSGQPNHEMDVLSGHENDVNYVQFSGCAVASRFSSSDISKEDSFPKFKNSCFNHDNIVTCSRDGSAIIWIPRSRRSYGKAGRWTRAYHLKVPPPPMPPQPPRGGPRQRFHPTPRGVNMIVWSLDNRFVLAAIMDCRICVWNAVDGSLVHSLTGHNESTYVLDVHPFNPRIAMSAGYDGKTIVWDIWEGIPIRVYETGRFKLVDGKFSPDGTSIILSDEVGQIYILDSGQGESQNDAKYDQFFLGDYRPLIQDTHGNVLDQETQLPPHRRNIQDLLCDSSMIPYPEPYQNMYQQRRLGALGIEWHPPSVKFAVGPSENGPQDYQLLPFADLDRWFEPLPEFLDAMDWEQENEVQSEDNDSEYNITEEDSSEGERECLSGSSSGDLECSAEDSEVDHSDTEGLRRSKRRKHRAEVEFVTSSGRRVKRRNLDECDGTLSRCNGTRKSRYTRKASRRRKSATCKLVRPQRLAARNALNLFSRINGASTDGEEEEDDEDGFESDSMESEMMPQESNNQSDESDKSTLKVKRKHPKEKEDSLDEWETAPGPCGLLESQGNTRNRRKLVFKFAVHDSKKHASENIKSEQDEQGDEFPLETTDLNRACSSSQEPNSVQAVFSVGCKSNKIKWGEVKARTSKRLRLSETPATDACASASVTLDGHGAGSDNVNGHLKSEDGYGMSPPQSRNNLHEDKPNRVSPKNEKKFSAQTTRDAVDEEIAAEVEDEPSTEEEFSQSRNWQKKEVYPVECNGNRPETAWHADNGYMDQPSTSQYRGYDEPTEGADMATDNKKTAFSCENSQEVKITHCSSRKLRIRSRGGMKESQSPPLRIGCESMSKSPLLNKHNVVSEVSEGEEDSSSPSLEEEDWNDVVQDAKRLRSCRKNKMNKTVNKRSKSHRTRMNLESDICGMEASTSNGNNHDENLKMDTPEVLVNRARRTRSMGMKAIVHEQDPAISKFKMREGHNSAETSKCVEKFAVNGREQLLCEEWRLSSRVAVGLRSARNRRENYYDSEQSPPDRRRTSHSVRKPSWLMLTEHEESCRYIPQQGDEVAYVRQGHKDYMVWARHPVVGPWRSIKGDLRAVEFCKVIGLDYSTLAGSGESCCKLTLEFIDPSSEAYLKTFKLTLPEVVDFSDFLVERTRYDAAVKRNWTHRDKCKVWWRNEDGEGGSWWEGRIQQVKPKLPEFPDCPWERYAIQYKGDSSVPHHHSPWELHDTDSRWEHPHIDDHTKEKLLSVFDKIEQHVNQDCNGIQKLKQVAHKSDFLNRFPVPLSLEVIQRRLENNYYRSPDAFKHDIMVMLSNVQSYFGKNAELGMKMRRLSDWVTRTLSSL